MSGAYPPSTRPNWVAPPLVRHKLRSGLIYPVSAPGPVCHNTIRILKMSSSKQHTTVKFL